MDTLTYRQPTQGEALVDLTEGDHGIGGPLHQFAGCYLLICCFGSRQIAPGRAALDALRRHVEIFDDKKMSFLGVMIDPGENIGKFPFTGVYFHLDKQGLLSRACGASPLEEVRIGTRYRVTWTTIDPSLHVAAHFDTGSDAGECDAVFAALKNLPGRDLFAKTEIPAPILVLPNVFDHDLCDQLVKLGDFENYRESGFMVDNVEVFKPAFKRRKDYTIEDEAVRKLVLRRIGRCVNPEIRKLFFMNITRMERYLVGCYAAEDNALFRAHRDNGQAITAHRRYAVSVALNEDFEGGALVFPEYNRTQHRVPKGWCIVFPCAILHEVTRVTRGRRYAFLPFLYDEAAASTKMA